MIGMRVWQTRLLNCASNERPSQACRWTTPSGRACQRAGQLANVWQSMTDSTCDSAPRARFRHDHGGAVGKSTRHQTRKRSTRLNTPRHPVSARAVLWRLRLATTDRSGRSERMPDVRGRAAVISSNPTWTDP
jgi:hypothetical protein